MIRVKLKSKILIAEQALLFTVNRPTDFQFRAGQFVEIKIPQIKETIPPHYFSIVSSEKSNELVFLARMRDSKFKNVLGSLSINDELEISEASGNWVLDRSPSKKIVFLVGGVGIAPVMSIFNSIVENEVTDPELKISLLYSNKTVSSASFYNELFDNWNSGRFSSFFAFTQELVDRERVYSKRIDKEVIEDIVQKSFKTKVNEGIAYYVCGTPEFALSMRGFLVELGVEVKFIKFDLFTGY
jgi:ferredoxin-NADP reductase